MVDAVKPEGKGEMLYKDFLQSAGFDEDDIEFVKKVS